MLNRRGLLKGVIGVMAAGVVARLWPTQEPLFGFSVYDSYATNPKPFMIRNSWGSTWDAHDYVPVTKEQIMASGHFWSVYMPLQIAEA